MRLVAILTCAVPQTFFYLIRFVAGTYFMKYLLSEIVSSLSGKNSFNFRVNQVFS
jgi:hypothetical protein